MIGGETQVVKRLDPIFAALAPAWASIPQTPGREKLGGTAEQGYLHCGPSGAGHFVKMVHNGIEYGLMAAYAEGLNILRHANVGKEQHAADAETTPLAHTPNYYQYDLNLADITEVWRRGSVIASWLLDLAAAALVESPDLANFSGRFPTPAKAAGPSPPRSTKPFRRRCSVPRSTRGSVRADRTNLATSCCPLCGTNSAATRRSPRRRKEALDGPSRSDALVVFGITRRPRPQDGRPGAVFHGQAR